MPIAAYDVQGQSQQTRDFMQSIASRMEDEYASFFGFWRYEFRAHCYKQRETTPAEPADVATGIYAIDVKIRGLWSRVIHVTFWHALQDRPRGQRSVTCVEWYHPAIPKWFRQDLHDFASRTFNCEAIDFIEKFQHTEVA